ncbi:MAG: hypothetical protein K1X29_04800 [Bdellovibrionales bacterium]|nr:hypothetical protein [Bdellovibrionales bacterium]
MLSFDCGKNCPWESVQFTAGTQGLPSLKLFFIVDNSYTMKSNQVNLSQSFDKIFDSNNSSNLTPFDLTVYLITTAQNSLSYSNPQLNLLQNYYKNLSQLKNLSLNTVTANERNTFLSGALPGDIIGYDIKQDVRQNLITFSPAPVLGLKDQGNGTFSFESGIHKTANESPHLVKTDFKNRLALLDPERSPTNIENPNHENLNVKFDELVDSESGLCSIARILRDNDPFVNPGDLPAFIVVTDENDSNPAGDKCVRSYQQFTGQEDLIKGYCETRKTKFEYEVTNSVGSKCTSNYINGYRLNYEATTQVPKTNITYSTINGYFFVSPQTTLSYRKIISKKYPSTIVRFFLKDCPIRDGVPVESQCVYNRETRTVYNDLAPDCNSMAKAINRNALLNSPYSPTCESGGLIDRANCSMTNNNCVIVPSDQNVSLTVVGDFTTSNALCMSRGQQISDVYIHSDYPITCTLSSNFNGMGPCPNNTPGCVTQATYANRSYLVDGDFSSESLCRQKASSLPGAFIDSSHNPSCTLTSQPTLLTKTFNIPFDSSNGSDPLTDPGQPCTPNFRNQVLNQISTQDDTKNWPTNGTCTVVQQNSQSKDLSMSSTNANSCRTNSLKECSESSLLKKRCLDEFIPAHSVTERSPFIINEELTCDSLCKASKTNVCQLSSSPQITENSTLQEYFLKIKNGANCRSSLESRNTVGNPFEDKLLSEANKICIPVNGLPTYLVQTGAPYRSNELIVDFVSGSQKIGKNNYAPGKNLTNYIYNRSSELFSANQLPITTVFIRRTNDNVGTGGSIGIAYEELINKMNGKKESVQSDDYSSALINLSQVIKSRIQRSFTLNQLKPYQRIRKVFLRARGTSDWMALEQSDWVASGNTVTINEKVNFNSGDDFQFSYY